MSRINTWLLDNDIRISANPCVSPDFCLDWPALQVLLEAGAPTKDWSAFTVHELSRFAIASGQVTLFEHAATGDCCWFVDGGKDELLGDGISLGGQRWAYPATWANLLLIKDLAQSFDAHCTIFPAARPPLDRTSLGIGARFTTLHWPGVDWAMATLGLPLTANQNSIPRELVFDVDAMLDDALDTCAFPFIGGDVPEGHQGQSVEGMSHGCVLEKLKNGFHRRKIPWGFNADHQPIGGKYDVREDALVTGCLLASYITFDISPELTASEAPADVDVAFAEIPAEVVNQVRERVEQAGIRLDDAAFRELLVSVWPAICKMQVRDDKYATIRQRHFSTEIGQAYYRELSIDELPGLTTPETLATMLALCEALDMPVQYVAPAFGFQKNFPFEDQAELERRVSAAWKVCDTFKVSIGFHSGSGKSAENYRLCGHLTGGALEIKTSGRYTYEMGHALSRSSDAGDQQLWQDWYAFTVELALNSAFADNQTEKDMARSFIDRTLSDAGKDTDVFADRATAAAALAELSPDPDHMLWFEYNFLYVLAAGGSTAKDQLGDHSPAGYAQRARFYAISDDGRLQFAKRVAGYIIFLAETCGLVDDGTIAEAKSQLEGYTTFAQLTGAIAG